MSVPVPRERLRAAVEERGSSAYLLTVKDDGSPQAVHSPLHWDDDVLVADVGKRSAGNAAARPAVSLLFPARQDDDYSLIVDGTAVVTAGAAGAQVRVTPSWAVLHRPGPAPAPGASCSDDCVPVFSDSSGERPRRG
jgi:hypothetical protein